MAEAQINCPKCGAAYPLGHQMCVRCGTRLPGASGAVGTGGSAGKGTGSTFRRGQVVANRYTVIDMIGRGGMGCIYKARDNTLDEDVALKTLLPKFTNDRHVVDRFFNEARIARQLSHPNIIRVHDIGMAGTVVYISMEYLQGRSLREWMESIPSGQHIPISYALRLMIQLSAALEFAHQFTVHRDLKPENLMITPEGRVKLMDFGISKLKSNVQLTSAQMVMGTPKYMSPEQLKDSSSVDHRSDIYALGAMLYELLTGHVPVGLARQPSEIRPEIPPALDALVTKCLAYEPGDRYQSAAELRVELQRLLDSVESTLGIEISELELPVVPAARGASLFRRIAGALLVSLVLAAGAFGVWQLERLESGGPADADPGAASALNPPSDPFSQAFDELTLRSIRAREKAVASQSTAQFVAEGDAFWEQARALAAQREADAFRTGWCALECYLGPLLVPPGMVFVPPGETVVERGAEPVFLSGFFIDEHEVTNGQFRAFALDAGSNWPMPDYLGAARLTEELLLSPVVGVTFYDALAYAAHTHPAPWGACTLPTEAQWARAAYGEARTPRPYPWGPEWSPGMASAAGEADGFPGAAPVGIFEPDTSLFGCRDLAGNVMEWTRSVFAHPYDASVAEQGLETIWFGSALAVRGGCYTDERASMTERRSAWFDEPSPLIGFRCVLPFPTESETLDAFFR